MVTDGLLCALNEGKFSARILDPYPIPTAFMHLARGTPARFLKSQVISQTQSPLFEKRR